jgi:hypothetical protein
MRTLASAGGRRLDIRLNKAFSVVVSSEVDGDCLAVARNVSAGGMFVEMRDPPPLGTVVTVSFQAPHGGEAMAVRAEVKHHFCFNYQQRGEPSSARGVGLRFIEFVDDVEAAEPPPAPRLASTALH